MILAVWDGIDFNTQAKESRPQHQPTKIITMANKRVYVLI